jgi:YesN/AraC family two-component response regulator
MSILIVDDEERDRIWLKNLLTQHLGAPYAGAIYEGHDGLEAVELSQKYKPQLSLSRHQDAATFGHQSGRANPQAAA